MMVFPTYTKPLEIVQLDLVRDVCLKAHVILQLGHMRALQVEEKIDQPVADFGFSGNYPKFLEKIIRF